MRFFGQAQVRDGVTLQAIRPALHQDELGFGFLQVGLHPCPRAVKVAVIGARREWNIEFRATRPAGSCLFGGAGARIQKTPVFMDVGEYQVRVILESVKHAVAMVRIDIDIGDSSKPELFAQVLGGDATIIKDTETGRGIASGVMQSGNGDKRAFVVAMHDLIHRAQYRADDCRCRVVNAGHSRRIAIIEPTRACG